MLLLPKSEQAPPYDPSAVSKISALRCRSASRRPAIHISTSPPDIASVWNAPRVFDLVLRTHGDSLFGSSDAVSTNGRSTLFADAWIFSPRVGAADFARRPRIASGINA